MAEALDGFPIVHPGRSTAPLLLVGSLNDEEELPRAAGNQVPAEDGSGDRAAAEEDLCDRVVERGAGAEALASQQPRRPHRAGGPGRMLHQAAADAAADTRGGGKGGRGATPRHGNVGSAAGKQPTINSFGMNRVDPHQADRTEREISAAAAAATAAIARSGQKRKGGDGTLDGFVTHSSDDKRPRKARGGIDRRHQAVPRAIAGFCSPKPRGCRRSSKSCTSGQGWRAAPGVPGGHVSAYECTGPCSDVA